MPAHSSRGAPAPQEQNPALSPSTQTEQEDTEGVSKAGNVGCLLWHELNEGSACWPTLLLHLHKHAAWPADNLTEEEVAEAKGPTPRAAGWEQALPEQ